MPRQGEKKNKQQQRINSARSSSRVNDLLPEAVEVVPDIGSIVGTSSDK
jgi:hypothetical protein